MGDARFSGFEGCGECVCPWGRCGGCVECKCECDGLEPTTFGVESDFQYVSTAPPISSVTPSNGVIILIPNDTYEKPIKRSTLKCSQKNRAGKKENPNADTHLSNNMQPMVQNR